ncbi:MAG: prolyl oligopeptidase family serine peptidase [Sphingopyxis sp.]|uniref:alpha/beta hydrolase family protein n=1 Tax=Sphingopyxis sp. TaxID=1908224 RepID=UPI002AB813B0|nr:prolyl oligopeptidase family serine peptidase [Sphingopyxis sp.]MDZ3831880.1 prolyl oligopeptidase family serine peptidase [Sphingopyxis sp.]
MMRQSVLAAALLSCAVIAVPGTSRANTQPIDLEAIDNWREFSLVAASGNMDWVAELSAPSKAIVDTLKSDKDAIHTLYPAIKADADGQYRLNISRRSAPNAKPFEILSAAAFDQMEFSPDGQWFAVVRAASDGKDSKKKTKELVLLDLRTGKQSVFANVEKIGFSSTHIFMKKGGDASDLVARDLQSGGFVQMGAVQDFAVNKSRGFIAWTVSADKGFDNGLYLSSTDRIAPQQLFAGEARFGELVWADRGDAFTAVKTPLAKEAKSEKGEKDGKKDARAKPVPADPLKASPTILAVSGVGSAALRTHEIGPATNGYPVGMYVQTKRTPYDPPIASWSDDRSAVLLNLTDILRDDDTAAKPAEDGKESAKKDDAKRVPNLALWHWNQVEIPNQEGQAKEVPNDRRYPAIFWKDSGTLVPLVTKADPRELVVADFTPSGISARFATVVATQKDRELDRENRAELEDGPIDVFLIDSRTGAKAKILDQVLRSNGKLSPDGRFFTYFQADHHHLYDIAGRTTVNLTDGLSASFITDRDDIPDRGPVDHAAWLESGGLILRDNWDLWYLPNPAANADRKPRRLTSNGAETRTSYSPASLMRIDHAAELETGRGRTANRPYLDDQLLVHALERPTRRSGLVRIDVASGGENWVRPLALKRLNGSGRRNAIQYLESQGGPRYLVLEEDMRSKSVVLTGDTGRPDSLFSDDWDRTPFRRKYARPAGMQIINYSCDWGAKMEGAMILPSNYRAGQRYPTVVTMYESGPGGTAKEALYYMSPSLEASGAMELASRGYAVLLADVGFQWGNPGPSSLQCLMPAVDAAVAAGVADPKRLGLHGHSWGGYQTLFHTTQTNRFAGAIAGAGLSDLVSMFGGVYWGGSRSQYPIIEKGQGRMMQPIWDDWQRYLDNSPLYHAQKLSTPLLMMHNDKDWAVGFYQGVQYFLALRRLGKPVAMLEYRGDGHGVEGRYNQLDYRMRHLEFWDHFLKGTAAPSWWKDGIMPYDMKDHLKGRFPGGEATSADKAAIKPAGKEK